MIALLVAAAVSSGVPGAPYAGTDPATMDEISNSNFTWKFTEPSKPGRQVMVEERPGYYVWRSTAEVCDPAYWRGR